MCTVPISSVATEDADLIRCGSGQQQFARAERWMQRGCGLRSQQENAYARRDSRYLIAALQAEIVVGNEDHAVPGAVGEGAGVEGDFADIGEFLFDVGHADGEFTAAVWAGAVVVSAEASAV